MFSSPKTPARAQSKNDHPEEDKEHPDSAEKLAAFALEKNLSSLSPAEAKEKATKLFEYAEAKEKATRLFQHENKVCGLQRTYFMPFSFS